MSINKIEIVNKNTDRYIRETRSFAYENKYELLEQKLKNLLEEIQTFEELIYLLKQNLTPYEMNLIVSEGNKIRLCNKKGENFLFFINSHKIQMIDNLQQNYFKKNNDLNQNLLFTSQTYDVYKLFFEKGINPNQEDKKGRFPVYNLLMERKSSHFDTVFQLFIDNGFDVNKKNKRGFSFFDYINHRYCQNEATSILWDLRNIIVNNRMQLPEKTIELLMNKFSEVKKHNFSIDVPLLPYCESIILKKNITSIEKKEIDVKKRL